MTSIAPERQQLLLRRVVDLYRQNFARTETARAWFASRGITDFAHLDRHSVGWSDGRLRQTLPEEPALLNELTSLGVFAGKGREYFAQCTVFPVYGEDGRIASLVGYGPEGKTRILPGHPAPLWNLAVGKSSPQLLLVPDILDGLALAMSGHGNVVALLPESGVFDPAPLKRWGVQRLTVLHGDLATSQSMVEELKSKLAPFPHAVVLLRGTVGAAALLAERGAKQLGEAVIAETRGLTALHIPGLLPLPGGLSITFDGRRYEVRGMQASAGKLRVTVRAERGGKLHIDTLDLYLARARRQLVTDLVRLHEVPVEFIEADVAKLLAACELRAAQPDLATDPQANDPIPEADRREAEAMGRDPKLIETIVEDFERCGLVGEKPNKVLSYLAMTSRKMARPLAILNLSSSGTGKSALQEATCAFCPPEEAIKISNLSPKALFHREKDSLRHKFLALEEGKGVEGAAYALRVLLSAGELTTEVATKDPATGRLVAMRNRVQGPVAVSLTTTSPDIDPETRSRFFLISADESPEQTAAILEFQRQQCTLEGIKVAEVKKVIYRRHHAFQRLLQPLHVVNPLVARLSGMGNRLTARRDQPKILALLHAVAFLRQFAKETKQHAGINYIDVDAEDLRIATELLKTLLGPGHGETSKPAHELLRVLIQMRKAAGGGSIAEDGEFTFTRRQVREFAKWERTRVHRYLAELLDLEYVLRDRSRRGMAERYTLAWVGEVSFAPSDSVLPFDQAPSPAKSA